MQMGGEVLMRCPFEILCKLLYIVLIQSFPFSSFAHKISTVHVYLFSDCQFFINAIKHFFGDLYVR